MVSRKEALRRLIASHCRRERTSASRPIRTMKIGMRGAVSSRTTPERRSRVRTTTATVRGINAARASCGR